MDGLYPPFLFLPVPIPDALQPLVSSFFYFFLLFFSIFPLNCFPGNLSVTFISNTFFSPFLPCGCSHSCCHSYRDHYQWSVAITMIALSTVATTATIAMITLTTVIPFHYPPSTLFFASDPSRSMLSSLFIPSVIPQMSFEPCHRHIKSCPKQLNPPI